MPEDVTVKVFAGVERMIAAAIKSVPAGPIGPAGSQGPAGNSGEKGAPGERGVEGVPGRDGRDALPMPGPAGEKGIDGRDGKDGKDGITEDRLKAVVAEMRAELRAEIVKSIRLDGRKFIVDGEVAGVLAVPLYRDVYKAGETYECGDFATFGGSTWHANNKTTEKPGVNGDWTLAVKHGRDAR